MNEGLLGDSIGRVAQLEVELREILGEHEASPDRVITLEKSYARLDELSIAQDELFRESLRAIEQGLYRAAHVLAWAGFVDFLHQYLWEHFGRELRIERPKWNVGGAEDLRGQADHVVIESGKAVKAYSNTLMKALHGLLNTRNECAHPSDYYPDLNDAIGYLSSLFKRIEHLQRKAAEM